MLRGKEPAQTKAPFIPQICTAYWGFSGEETQAGAPPSQDSPPTWRETSTLQGTRGKSRRLGNQERYLTSLGKRNQGVMSMPK